ncbi:Palmitoyl-protein thioesterase 1 [Erysiphe neolycopersici]|uniref:Palmitoyl-protein thioesterase 1 n=1 Tax=Erysiphe neolycopersici TaxID=212602 RepID=A0A420H6U8_9PEZI|nr:Palmitoyl-protein thioesterase 1 [Erysiphe neolycopersici]
MFCLQFSTIIAILAITPFALASTSPRKNQLSYDEDKPLPLIIWHGLGDNYKSEGMTNVAALAEAVNPGTFTYIIRIEDEPVSDRSVTFFGNVTSQIEKVCADLASDPVLSAAPAVDALGFSQGGQFLRGYIERCNNPPVRSLVTFGSQHNGISKFETCDDKDFLCRVALGFLRSNIWSNVVQNYLVPAQYFRDPSKLADYAYYLTSSNFLADINNEREEKNQIYKQNLASLKRFVMYMFQDDETVVPKESSWFAEVNGSTVTPIQERQLFKEDWLGLRALDEKKALVFKTVPGRHMQLNDDELTDVIKRYFGPLNRKFDKETEISIEDTYNKQAQHSFQAI